MEKYYRFAGIDLSVVLPEGMAFASEGALGPFAVDAVTQPHRFICSIVDTLIPPEGECIYNGGGFRVYRDGETQLRYVGSVQKDWRSAYMRVINRGREHRIELKKDACAGCISAKAVLTAMAVEHLTAQAGSFVFHSSFIEWKGRAILFTAPSGTGKSTQAELWRSLRDARIINGDRSAVLAEENSITAFGIPFSGSSPYCENRSLPLAAIVYLEQAPVTAIRRLRGSEAFARIWEGISVNVWDREDVSLVSDTVLQTVRQVPVYHLACTPDESAVYALENLLERQV